LIKLFIRKFVYEGTPEYECSGALLSRKVPAIPTKKTPTRKPQHQKWEVAKDVWKGMRERKEGQS